MRDWIVKFKDKKISIYIVMGILCGSILGTLLHFVYEWTGKNVLAGLFSPINESVWEHMKLVFFPMLLYMIIAGQLIKKEYPCVFLITVKGILLGTALIPILFYTYTGIIGRHMLWADIAIFLIGITAGFLYGALPCQSRKYAWVWYIIIGILLLLFLLFTLAPPPLPLFVDASKS